MEDEAYPKLQRAGDSAWLVTFGDSTDDDVNNAAIAFDAWVRAKTFNSVVETAPTIRSVLVHFDPLHVEADALVERLDAGLHSRDWRQAPPPAGRRLWHVPVLYGGTHGPHLEAVAATTGVAPDELIRDHGRERQRVRMLGFAPGLAYVGMLSELWDVPRRTEIAPAVPPGTVAVAVRQSVLSSTTIPTGWHLIGRTPWRAFAVDREPPFALAAGDEIVFEAIDETRYHELEARAEAGQNVARSEELG